MNIRKIRNFEVNKKKVHHFKIMLSESKVLSHKANNLKKNFVSF